MSSKREREYEQRRYDEWQQRQAAHHAARRRQRIVVGSVPVPSGEPHCRT